MRGWAGGEGSMEWGAVTGKVNREKQREGAIKKIYMCVCIGHVLRTVDKRRQQQQQQPRRRFRDFYAFPPSPHFLK